MVHRHFQYCWHRFYFAQWDIIQLKKVVKKNNENHITTIVLGMSLAIILFSGSISFSFSDSIISSPRQQGCQFVQQVMSNI